jgi:predicted Holliday junction resolvase-like endonuclease
MAKANIEKKYNTIIHEHNELNKKFNLLIGQIESRALSLKDEWVNNEKKEIERICQEKALNELNKWKTENEKYIRNDAIKRSGEVTRGKVFEQFIPFFPNFPYNPKEARFLGTPVDLIVFKGLSDNNVTEVVFIEVKTGKTANLTRRERSLKQCIDSKAVRYKIIQLSNNQIRLP